MPTETNCDRLLNEDAAAEILCCSPALLRKMRLFRKGPTPTYIGRLVRYSERDLATYIESCREERGGK
jgi:hypothetical protein